MINPLTISTDTSAFQWSKKAPYAGLPGTAVVALLLWVGHLTGHSSAGAIAAGAAYTVGFAVFHAALGSILLSMTILTLGIASATLAGSLGADWTAAVLLLVLIVAINYGVLSALSPTAGWMGLQCGIFVIVATYFPRGPRYAVGRTLMVLLGGAAQIAVSALVHYVRHRHEEASLPPLAARLRARLSELWRKLRSEVRQPGSQPGNMATYTLRMAITLLVCAAIYRHYHVRNGYWSPMTALLVMKPEWTATLSRGIARFLGTLAGAGIALLLAHTVPISTALVFALVVVTAWACYALQAVNYAFFSLFVTLYIVFLFRFGGFSQTSAAHIRLFNTALGGSIALLIDAVWLGLERRRRQRSSVLGNPCSTRR